ncbi:MAG: galactokinase [Clostridium sp.]|nr:galactokinase [Clostridium sp.]
MKISETLQALDTENAKKLMAELYTEAGADENTERYRHVANGFKEAYGDQDILLFSSPGRTEISGNHTDHNHGKVLAGSINLDCVGAAAKNGTDTIRILSETFNQKFIISLKDLKPSPGMAGTIDLTKGILKGFQEKGYQVGGFDAFITSNVISAAGVSSSASYEMLICSMVNTLFNDGAMDVVTYSHIGKYAENHYWNKASGLLDQMACAVGGLVTIDFKNPEKPAVEKLSFDFGAQDHSLVIVNTGKGHADLSEDYSSIPNEMKKVAEYFHKEVCAEIDESAVIAEIAKVRAFAGDRSVMRALHFFEENRRVEKQVKALKEHDFAAFLKEITESGNSSWKWLQNVYTTADVQEQGISIALALTELFLAEKKRGACRVHGGGFAGVIMAMLPNDLVDEYVEYIEKAIGAGNAYRMNIRPYGAICVSEKL